MFFFQSVACGITMTKLQNTEILYPEK